MTQNLSRRDLMWLGATGVAAASIAGLPVTADENAPADKLPKRRYGRTGLEIGWLVGASDWPKELIPRAVNAVALTGTRPRGGMPTPFRRSSKICRGKHTSSNASWTA